jgi:hypothetical protein
LYDLNDKKIFVSCGVIFQEESIICRWTSNHIDRLLSAHNNNDEFYMVQKMTLHCIMKINLIPHNLYHFHLHKMHQPLTMVEKQYPPNTILQI